MTKDVIVSELTPLFKAARWKKAANFFFREINKDTLAYHQPFMKKDVLRIQYGAINRVLNRVVWDLHGISQKFGTPAQQLTSAFKCHLYFTVEALEISEPQADAKAVSDIGDACLRNADKFSSIDKIRAYLDGMSPERQIHFADDRLCVALADGDTATAKALILRAEKEHITFELSIFARAKDAIAAKCTS